MNECCKQYVNDIVPKQSDYENKTSCSHKTKFKWKELRQCDSCEIKFRVHFIAEFDIEADFWETWVYAANPA